MQQFSRYCAAAVELHLAAVLLVYHLYYFYTIVLFFSSEWDVD